MLTIALLFCTLNLHSQKRLEVYGNTLKLKYSESGDSAAHAQSLQRIRNAYLLNGYRDFSIDSIMYDRYQTRAYVYAGNRYLIAGISISGDSSLEVYRQLTYKYRQSVYDTGRLEQAASGILDYLENNGYPFSVVQLSQQLASGGIAVHLNVDRGPYFEFDTAHIEGDAVVRKSFLEAYTGIRSGQPYSEALLRKAGEKLMQLPFLTSFRLPQMVFLSGGKARPYYYLNRKRSDQLNGIIGLAPGTGASGNPVLTGEFALRLNNLFKSAKVLSINWRSFKARSQELKAYAAYPYMFNRPIGADAGFELLKFDTLYTVFQRQAGIQYYTSGLNGMKIFYRVHSTNLNTVDTTLIRSTRSFPSVNAVETRQYGLMFNFMNLDYRFNPRKGIQTEMSISVGSKTILRDNQIAAVLFGPDQRSLYDSVKLGTTQYQYMLKAEKYFPAGKSGTIRTACYLNRIIAPVVYFNELFREGGINSLKGFNEQSIFADNFNMLELEYRYLIGLNSHIRVFWNGAYYEDESTGRNNNISDTPWGFGVGGNIETGAGILTLIYALGKERSNAFDLRTGKFHFGLSSYF